MRKFKTFACLILFSCAMLPFSVDAAASSDSVEILFEPGTSSEMESSAELSVEISDEPCNDVEGSVLIESNMEISTEASTETEPESDSEASTEASTEAESDSEASTETDTHVPPMPIPPAIPPAEYESDSTIIPGSVSNEESNSAQKGPFPSMSDVIIYHYRMYHGRPQYRRWNQTRDRWEDPVWRDGSVTGIKKMTLHTGCTLKLKVGLISPRYSSKPVFWKSKKPKVVRAYKNGKILARRRGITYILAVNRKTKHTVAKVKIIVR